MIPKKIVRLLYLLILSYGKEKGIMIFERIIKSLVK